MDEKLKNYCAMLATVMSAFLAIAISAYVSSYSKSIAPSRVFTASGEGKIAAAPDIVELSFGVLTEGGTNLAGLTKENNNKVNSIIASLKEKGVDGKDITTQFYNITPRYQYFSCNPPPTGSATPCPPAEIVGYSVNQNVFVKIRNIGKAGDMLSAVVERGANTVSGLSFTIEDPAKLQDQARGEAIAKAREKAAAIARAGGFRLGKLVAAQESPSPIPFSQPLPFGGKGGGGEIIGAAIEPGSQDIIVDMALTYEIK